MYVSVSLYYIFCTLIGPENLLINHTIIINRKHTKCNTSVVLDLYFVRNIIKYFYINII